jgi:hypothetical protein
MLGRATSRHLVVCGQFHRKGRHAARPAAHQLRTGCRESPNPWRSSGSPRSAGDGACGMPCRLLPSRREQQIAVARRAYPAQVEIADRAECWYPCSHRGRPVAAAPLSRASRLAAASRARDRRQAARSHPPETCLRYYARLFDEAPEHPGPGGGSDSRVAPSLRPSASCRLTGGRALDALARPGDHRRCADLAIYLHLTKALCRTRTGDPFLTMEVLYQLS